MPESIASENYLPDYFTERRYWTDLTVHRDPVGNRSMEEIAAEMKPVRYEQARVMGGGSSINGQVALRGVPSDYDEWERLGAAGWGWRDCLPYFRKLERDMDFDGPLHGRDGPFPIRRTFPKDWGGFALAFRDAAAGSGIPYHDDANAEPGTGCFPFPRNNVYGRRVSTALAYLDDATRLRQNLHIVPHALVEGIAFEGRRAVAVRGQRVRPAGQVRGPRDHRVERGDPLAGPADAIGHRSGRAPARPRHSRRRGPARRRRQPAGSSPGRARAFISSRRGGSIRACATPS